MQFQIIFKSAFVALIASQFCLASIKYSGLVKNSAGKPVPHAQVTLKGSSLTTFTDTAGAFSITGNANPSSGNFLYKAPLTLNFYSNKISLVNDANDQKSLRLYDLRGTKVAAIQGADNAISLPTAHLSGLCWMDLGKRSCGLRMIFFKYYFSNKEKIYEKHSYY